MAMAESRSELAGLVRALMGRLDMADSDLLSSCVDVLAKGVRPHHQAGDMDLAKLAAIRSRIHATLSPDKREAFESSFLRLAARRDPDMPQLFSLLAMLSDNAAVKAMLRLASIEPTSHGSHASLSVGSAAGSVAGSSRADGGDFHSDRSTGGASADAARFMTPVSTAKQQVRRTVTSAATSRSSVTIQRSTLNPESARRGATTSRRDGGDGGGVGDSTFQMHDTPSRASTSGSTITDDLKRVLASVRSSHHKGSAGRSTRITTVTTTTTTTKRRGTRGGASRLSEEDLDPSVLRLGTRVMLKSGAMGGAGGFLSLNDAGQADACGCGLARASEVLVVVSPSVTSLMRDMDDTGPVLLGDQVALRSPVLNKYLCADAGTGNLVFKTTRGRWEVVAPAHAAAVGSSSGSGDGFVHVNERVCLRSKSGLCMQLANTSHGTSRLCLGAPSGTYGTSQLGSLDWYFVKAHAPFEPEWNRSRPFLIGAELAESSLAGALTTVPTPLQESMLVEDLLYVLLGVEGSYIQIRSVDDGVGDGTSRGGAGATAGGGAGAGAGAASDSFEGVDGSMRNVEFYLAERAGINESLAFLVERILPLARHYVRCSWYAEMRSRYEAGLVANAFAAACRLLLREYTLLIAQLESFAREGRLSLQKLWFFLQPSLRTLATLDDVIFSAPFAMGGALLNSVHKASARSGDAQARSVARFLLERAAVPYIRMLEKWIFYGVLEDPHGEFMVHQEDALTKESMQTDPEARYWADRYTVQAEQVPMFLSSLEDDILTTGKYLNVLRGGTTRVESPVAITIPFAEDARDYSGIVHQARHFASKELLDHVMTKTQLLPRLVSLKRYFLLHEGDFLVHFLDLAGDELSKPVEEVVVPRLQSLLELSVRSSIASSDEFKDDLVVVLQRVALLQKLETASQKSAGIRAVANPASTGSLNGWAAFALDYKVEWPLSIVLSRSALSRYQMLFQHLFFCKHVERRLCNTWLSQQATKELRLGGVFAQWHGLRHRMLHFMQNLTYYMMTEVLEPRWHELEKTISRVKDVDELKNAHDDFLYKCLDQCLLTHTHLELLKILTKLTTLCLLFADQVTRLMASLEAAQAASAAVATSKAVDPEVRARTIQVASEQFSGIVAQHAHVRTIARDNEIFDQHLRQFMARLRDRASQQFNSHLANLCTRLDYNDFYGDHLAL